MLAQFFKYIIFSSIFLLFSSLSYAQPFNEKFEFSGFARAVLGYFDETENSFLGYDNSLSVSEQSLIAFQVDYQISDKFSATSQVIAHSAKERDSGVEWLYLTYEPNRFSQIKIGRQRTPFFNYSDVIDVGFAYPWITLPQQVYNSVFFSTFDGVLGGYEWAIGDTLVNFEAFYGEFDGEVPSENVNISGKAEGLRGVILNVTYDNFNFRSAYHRTNGLVEIDELTEFKAILTQSGFTEGGESLDSNGNVEFYQLGLSYETLNFFLRGEATRAKAESNVIPSANSFFISAGYNYFPYTTYISYAKSNGVNNTPDNFIPLGISDDLNRLSAGFDFISAQLKANDSSSIALGTRWDLKANLAIKAEVSWTRSEFFSTEGSSESNDDFLPLYQLAIEWVF